MQTTFLRPPSRVNGGALSVTTPVPPGVGVVTNQRLSNLDLNGKLVKRGLYVSHGGMRYLVTRVNRGHFYAHRVGFFAPPFVSERMRCESVQVVE